MATHTIPGARNYPAFLIAFQSAVLLYYYWSKLILRVIYSQILTVHVCTSVMHINVLGNI